MTEADIKNYVKTQLGISWVDVEAEDKDIKTMIQMALDKLAPYYEGVRYVQASGKVIDLSLHDPVAIRNVWNCKNDDLISVQEYAFGGNGIYIYDATFLNRFIGFQSYKVLQNELNYQKSINYKYIKPYLYLDDYKDTVLIEMTVRPKVVSDVENDSMYCSWVKEYTLALTKELVGRVRSKFSVEGSPYTLDGNTLLQEAAAEKANLENQLIGEIYIL